MKTIGVILACVLLAGCASPAANVPTATNQQVPSTVPTVALTQTAYPTYTAQPTYTPNATYTALPTLTPANTVEVTQIIIRIITATPLPAATRRPTSAFTQVPLPSSTPAGPTNTPEPPTPIPPTPDLDASEAALNARALIIPRFDGNYLVNVDIGPGVWRNDGSASDGTDCYWERLTRTNDIIDNYIGSGGGTMFIDASDFAVHMERCGKWTFISP